MEQGFNKRPLTAKHEAIPGLKLTGEYTDSGTGITLPVYEMPVETVESWNAKADRLNRRGGGAVHD